MATLAARDDAMRSPKVSQILSSQKKGVPAPLTETFTTMIAKSTSANIVNGISFHNHEMKKRKKRKAACYNRFFPHPEPCAPESARQLVVPAYERATRERASKQRGSDQGGASWGVGRVGKGLARRGTGGRAEPPTACCLIRAAHTGTCHPNAPPPLPSRLCPYHTPRAPTPVRHCLPRPRARRRTAASEYCEALRSLLTPGMRSEPECT